MSRTVKTNRLELTDAYIAEWTSEIHWIDDSLFALADSAFYPGGGGQPRDRGWIIVADQQVPVECLGVEDEQVRLKLAEPLGTRPATGRFGLDWDHRYRCMRVHTAYHCLVGLAWSQFGAKVTGGGMAEGQGRIDFSPEIDRAGIEEVFRQANAAIQRGAATAVEFIPASAVATNPELVKLVENRAPMSEGGTFRTIVIEGIDREIDGGTHVRNIREVGRVQADKISSAGKGCKRVKFSVAD